ncbi:MAG: sugar-binding domain-containing protein [Rhodopirellula sp. JB053]
MKSLLQAALLTLFCLSVVFCRSAGAGERMSFDSNWKFSLGDFETAQDPTFDDAQWRTLNVPHDWSIEGEYSKDNPMGAQCGYLPAGIGWYRKTIPVDSAWKGKHVEITFDGVYMNSTVWANGKKLGVRPYGWNSFTYDISDVIAGSDKITFAIRVDNEKQPSARWYTGWG